MYEESGVHYYEDGHFWMEVPGLPERDSDDESHILVKQNMKVKFSADPIKVLTVFYCHYCSVFLFLFFIYWHILYLGLQHIFHG